MTESDKMIKEDLEENLEDNFEENLVGNLEEETEEKAVDFSDEVIHDVEARFSEDETDSDRSGTSDDCGAKNKKTLQLILFIAMAAVMLASVIILLVYISNDKKRDREALESEIAASVKESEDASREDANEASVEASIEASVRESELATEPEPTEPEWAEMTDEDPVKITEVLFKNTYSLIDEFGERLPWVEICNTSDFPVTTAGLYLSDDELDLLKWALPEKVLAPGERIVIFLSGARNDENHTGFKVSKKEALILSDAENYRYQTVNPPENAREENISYGIQDGEWLYFGVPTPGQENTSHGVDDIASAVSFNPQGLFVSEVSAAHAPRNGETDWVELFNGSDETIDLTGFTLSEDDDEPLLHNLSGTIEPDGYKVFKLTKDSQVTGDNVIRFGLSESGETLYLFDETGILLDEFSTGALRANVSSGRETGSTDGARVFFTEQTRGSENGISCSGMLTAPVFSMPGGFYPEADSLEITISGEGEIHYTLDGSIPTKESPLYLKPITLTGNTAVSAVSFLAGNLNSDRATATYIFEEMPKLPVVCLSISKSDLSAIFSKEVQVRPTTTIIERECFMEYYETDGKLGTSAPAGARIAGDGTRLYPQKSICLYFRSGYGRSSVTYPFFEDYEQLEFSSLLLRNGGQDAYRTRIIDTYCSMLGKGMETDYAESRPAVIFINGQYYGIYDLKENQNEDFFEYRHNIDGSNMNVIRRNYFLLEGSTDQISMVYEYAKTHSLAGDAEYQEFLQWVDADAFIDYIIVQAFIGNDDMYNQKYYNVRDWSSKIRPVLFDLDYGLYAKKASILRLYFSGDGVASTNGTLTNMWIPTALKTNASWCEKFVERAAWAINEHFTDALERFDALVEEVRPEMARNIARWKTHSSLAEWEADVAAAREALEYRPTLLKKSLQSVFGLSDARMKELFPND